MAAVLMSNPGLHMAVLGNPKTRRNKRKKASAKKRRQRVRRKAKKQKKTSTAKRSNPMAKTKRNRGRRRNPRRNRKANGQFKKGHKMNPKTRRNKRTRRNKSRRRNPRRNPTLAATGRQYVRGLTTAPTKVMSLFKGRNALRNGLWTAGGAVGAYWLGGFASTYLRPVLARVPGLGTDMGQRIVGSLMPYTGAFLASMLVKDAQLKSSLRLGGAVASIVEFVAPGKVGELIRRLPGGERIAPASSPVEGLWGIGAYVEDAGYRGAGEYVDAPSYAGTGEYVDAPSYAGTGEDVMLAGYVEDSGYRGAGEEMLAGNFLEESSLFQPAI